MIPVYSTINTVVFLTSDNVYAVSLVLIGLLLSQPFENLFAVSIPEKVLPKIKFGAKFALLFIAVMITVDLIKNLVIIGRRRLEGSILSSSGAPRV